MLALDFPITNLHLVGAVYANRLMKLGIKTVCDLLYHLPFRYEDYSIISNINMLQPGEKVTVRGKVILFENVYTKSGKKIQKILLSDETGEIEIIWYNQPFLKNILKPGINITICGEVKWSDHKFIFEAPEYETIRSDRNSVHTGRLVPIYPETAGVSSKWLRSRIYNVLFKLIPKIDEDLPNFILREYNLINKREAIHRVHFPRNIKDIEDGRKRLSFDELLEVQLAAKLRQKNWQKIKVEQQLDISSYLPQVNKFIDKLPFRLTQGQQKAIDDILSDLRKSNPMNRLLEGDVGCGKTAVATVAMFITALNKFQSLFMAPTEILATQHYETVNNLLSPYDIQIALLTGKSQKKEVVRNKYFDIYIGTHALLSEKLKLSKAGLVVIDEQQRFGVSQRASLREKGINPHVLTLTATPIPRTVALTIYSDLDLSVIDELPEGRIPVKTWVVPPVKRNSAYQWIERQIENSNHTHQAFIICPFVEESESLTTVKAAKVEFEKLQKEVFPKLSLGLLHGRMKAKDKNKVMDDLKKHKYDILVATPVVEVGIDIPSATIVMIEAAERFGLSQLHQLRGRVGRSSTQSYCLLFTQSNNTKIIERLKFLERIYSGPKLSEIDLKLRGGGELYGTKQHGSLGFKIADISDLSLIENTRKAAISLFAIDKTLSQFPLLREMLQKYKIQKVAPD